MRSWRSNIATLHDEDNVLQSVSEMSDKLTEFEKEVYDFIKGHREILISNMPARMNGAIPNLKNKGLIEVYKKITSRWASKKRKFVKASRS